MRTRTRFGLQARMTASYVLVTAAVVILVEAVAIGFVIPNLLAAQDLSTRVAQTAGSLAQQAALVSTSADHLALPAAYTLGQPDSPLGPGQEQASGNGIIVPQVLSRYPDSAGPLSMALVFTPDGRIVASSYPSRYPIGSEAYPVIPSGAVDSPGGKLLTSPTVSGRVTWAVEPIILQLLRPNPLFPPGKKKGPPDGFVYVQAPVQSATIASLADAAPLLQTGLVLLLLTLPVGLVFGMLTTRGVVRRLRRLGRTTGTFAEGDFTQRVTPGLVDEVGQLERDFNTMAERLQAAVRRERAAAEKSARLNERSRISRELHDSISQDLFSLGLLAGGLEKALPDGSPVRAEVRTLAETVQSANREMRALLLELRPTTLEEKGLLPALEELTSSYAQRLGIRVDADLEPVRMAPAGELAALRIAQEGLANAIKHAQAKTIRLAVRSRGTWTEITVSDDGRGFTPSSNGATHGLGLRLMQERVEELGGSLSIDSRPGQGTVLSATLPAGP